MPLATVRGVSINYEVCGDDGPWVALSPGGRRPLTGVRSLAQHVAALGYRVVVHDRRNCGASQVAFDDRQSEFQHWADDLHELLSQLGALPAWIGGGSSGCRLSLLYAMRYPEMVSGLLLWRVTGGAFAVNRLAHQYYGQYIEAAKKGGMAAVCGTEHFSERISSRPDNRDLLMAIDPQRFVEVMERWRQMLMADAELPVIGAREEDLKAIIAPACIIPGNDNTHSRENGEDVHRLLPNSELHVLYPEHEDVDLVPSEDWAPKEPEMASIFVDFMRRNARIQT